MPDTSAADSVPSEGVAADEARRSFTVNEGGGTVALVDWPRSLRGLLREMGRRAPRLLPKLDSLVVDYTYAAREDDAAWTFDLRWVPGDYVLDRGDVQRWSQAPPDTRMVSVELLADVLVNGRKEAEMIVAVDSMALPPAPDVYGFDVTVGYDRVFLDTDPAEAQRYLRQDVTLTNLRVERMGFASFATGDASVAPDDRADDAKRREPDVRERRTPEPSIYTSNVRILIGWRVGPSPYYVGGRDGRRDDRRTERPRGDSVGQPTADADRTRTSTRTDDGTSGDTADDDRTRRDAGDDRAEKGSGGTSKRDDDRDDKDDEDLVVPALAAAAAVGVVAHAGGTVGLYGTGETPLGLTAGVTRPSGGVQLQAAINPAVIDDQGTQKLTAKVLGFYDVFSSRVQPALGLGVQAEATDETRIEPSVSAGLAANTGRIVFYGGFDIVQQTPEIGIAYNFRSGSRRDDDELASRR